MAPVVVKLNASSITVLDVFQCTRITFAVRRVTNAVKKIYNYRCVFFLINDFNVSSSAKDAATAAESTTRIIRVEGEPGKEGAVTLPFLIPGGNVRKWQVKAAHCLLPKATGWCRASVPSFYYDADQLKCLPFIYGGCRVSFNYSGGH